MIYIAISSALLLAALWIAQLVPTLKFLALYRRPITAAEEEGGTWPRFAVFMPLRGGDDYIRQAIAGMLRQDYPDYELKIIVDHETDPARRVAEEAVREGPPGRGTVSILRDRRPACSLLCSSLVQFVDELDDSHELITFCSGDLVAPPNWLREMALAMREPDVGATLGNRWYLFEQGRWGTVVRHVLNVISVVPMWMYEIPWGGALALRRRDVLESGLREAWAEAMVEDAPVKTALRPLGRKFRFAPQLILSNRDEIGLATCFRFIKRQMLWTRLYHPGWRSAVLNAALFTLAVGAPILLAPLALMLAEPIAAALLAVGWVGYLAGMLLLLALLERGIRRMLRERGEAAPRYTAGMILRVAVALPLTYLLYMAAIVAAMLARRVEWRGITYRITGGGVTMEAYRPFADVAASPTPPVETRA